MSKSRRPYESRDVAQAAARMVKALVRRAGDGDQEALYELQHLEYLVRDAVNRAGAAYYENGGVSWADVATELGVTRQAARKRFTPYLTAPDAASA